MKSANPPGGGLSCGIFHDDVFEKIISLENLFSAWQEFSCGKSKRRDVQEFEFNLEDNIFALRGELKSKTYRHSNYTAFSICDPKPRRIHKATVRDRILHHAIFRILYPISDKSFIFDSYSCRTGKGTHRAVRRLESFCRKFSRNNRKNIFALKCDVKKFFDSVDQDILLGIIGKNNFGDATRLLENVIRSFEKEYFKGLPLGNVTSQLFANMYMDELDHFVKHELRVRYYLRYSDDFVILSDDENYLKELIGAIGNFLQKRLKLRLHGNKVIIRKYRRGIDFLGYVVFPYHIIMRTRTKRRMLRKIKRLNENFKNGLISEKSFNQSLQSYLGILKHCRGYKIQKKIEKMLEETIL